MIEWQPIETAPEFEHILCAWIGTWPSNPRAEMCNREGKTWAFSSDGDAPARNPTHWMRLPVLSMQKDESPMTKELRDLNWGQVVQCLMRIMDHPKVGENGMENDREQAIRMANALFEDRT
jgi:hypothetical protein